MEILVDLVSPDEIRDLRDCQALMLIVSEKCSDTLKEYLDIKIPYFGGIFPGVIFGDKKYDDKIISVRFTEKVRVFRDDEMPEEIVGTLLVFVDGIYERSEEILEKAFEKYGLKVSYIGGGAGSLSFSRVNCLFDNRGFFREGAIFANIPVKARVTARHGWTPTNVYFVATKTRYRRLIQLDWQPAFDVYKAGLKEIGIEINQNNFFDVAKEYPFGMTKIEGEFIVRDPIMASNSEITCAGSIPQNTVLTLMKGEKENLIQAARNCGEKIEGEQVFVGDCISRVLYLGKDFKRELKAIHKECFGPLTIGEIATSKTFVEFHNKTIVVGDLEC